MDFIFDPSLVLYLPLYGLDGASFMSRDAYGHLCTVTGALWRPNGRYFDGSDDVINCGDIGHFTQLTLAAWVNADTHVGYDGVICQDPIGDRAVWFVINDGKLRFTGYHDGTASGGEASQTTATMTTRQWYNITGTWEGSGGKVKIYIDTVEVKSGNITNDIHDSSGNYLIGNDEKTVGRFFNGLIGEVWVYRRALTSLEIQHNYLATKWRYK